MRKLRYVLPVIMLMVLSGSLSGCESLGDPNSTLSRDERISLALDGFNDSLKGANKIAQATSGSSVEALEKAQQAWAVVSAVLPGFLQFLEGMGILSPKHQEKVDDLLDEAKVIEDAANPPIVEAEPDLEPLNE